MEGLEGKQGSWQFSPDTVLIRFAAGRRTKELERDLGKLHVPMSAIAAVEFRPLSDDSWRLGLRLHPDMDPFALVGGALPPEYDPLRLDDPGSSQLLAEYYADYVRAAAEAAVPATSAEAVRAQIAPSLPVHLKVAEGSLSCDGNVVRLQWDGFHAGLAKSKEAAREFPLADIEQVQWTPGTPGDFGHVRLVTAETRAEPRAKPTKDLAALLTLGNKQHALGLLAATAVAARLNPAEERSRDDASPQASAPSPAPPKPTEELFAQIRQLGQLRDEGLLSDAEFEAKKAELLDRL